MKYGSKELIGIVKKRYEDLRHKNWGWSGFYNGWLEGRSNMLTEIRKENLTGYEYHNHETGHCFLDYDLGDAVPEGIENIKDYTKTPLYKV